MLVEMCMVLLYFFFSSRRRHTRFDCDWSSDVCSSDLRVRLAEHAPLRRAALRRRAGRRGLQDRGGQHAGVLPARGHAGGQECAGAGAAGRHARLDRKETVMFQLRKLGHVVLNVTDLEASVRFYTEVLGLSISDRYPDSMLPGAMAFMSLSTDHHAVALLA